MTLGIDYQTISFIIEDDSLEPLAVVQYPKVHCETKGVPDSIPHVLVQLAPSLCWKTSRCELEDARGVRHALMESSSAYKASNSEKHARLEEDVYV